MSALNIPVDLSLIRKACESLREVLPVTPLTLSLPFSELLGIEVYFKWESKFRTGSFKERGAAYFLSSLSPEERARGVCAASAGNHALALSYHASQMGIPCVIVMPTTAPLVKVENTQRTGAETILHGLNFDEALTHAEELSRSRGLTFVPAFDHPWTIAGQGSCGIEILEQLPEVDAVIVPVGGGGLISGIGTAMKALSPKTFILGVQSAWALQAQERINRGDHSHNRLSAPSIADGIAVKRMGKLTGSIIERTVDRLISVSEREIAHGVIQFLESERSLIEGAGGAGIAALTSKKLPNSCKKVVVIACGSNVDITMLARLIQGDLAEQGKIVRLRVSVADRPGSLHTITGMIAASGANILEVFHDRSFSSSPGMVEIMVLLELRGPEHGAQVIAALEAAGVTCRTVI